MTTTTEHLQHLETLCTAIRKFRGYDHKEDDLNLVGIAKAIKGIPIHRYGKRERRALDDFNNFWRQHIKA